MDYEDALDKIEELIELIDENIDSVGPGQEFFENVRDSLVNVEATITKNENCTERQAGALRNWEAGLEKWIHDD